jgi:ABC-type transport system involved in multi-copper enzyme maturation permease subunit
MIPQVFLVLFITPAITSGTLTIEREQQTMDMLTLTRLSRRSIVVGKLLSAVLFTALLIVSSLPLMSICFMLGSIDPGQVLSAYLEMLSASVLIGAMGIMWSSISRTTTQAVMMTYITLFVVFIFGWLVFAARISPTSSTAAASVFQAIGAVWFGSDFMGLHAPDGTGFTLFCLLCGLLMTAVASVRIEMFPHRKAYILRGLTLVLFAVQFLALDMSWTNAWYKRGNAAVMVAVHPPIGVLMLTAMALLLLTPVFATGVLESFEARRFLKYIVWGFSPDGLKRGKLASGIPFLMVTTLLCLGLYAISFVVAGQRTAITRSGALSLGLPGVPPPEPPHLSGKPGENVTVNGNSVSVQLQDGTTITAMKIPSGLVQVNTYYPSGQTRVVVQAAWPASVPALPPPPPPQKIVTPETGDFWQGALVLIVSVAGFGMLNVLFSIVFRARWVAIILAYVVLLMIFVIPEVGMGLAGNGSGTSSADSTMLGQLFSHSTNLMYLNPVQAFLQMCEPATYWQARDLVFGETPMWQVITEAWTAIGLLSFIAMIPFVRRIANENEPIPYEEQVQLS